MTDSDGNVIIILVIVSIFLMIFLYISFALLLSRLNKVMYGKGTILSWLPLIDIYLLGKLTVSNVLGFILVILNALIALISNKIFTLLYGIVCLSLYIYAGIKYKKLKKAQTVQVSLNTDPNSLSNNIEQIDVDSTIENDFYKQNNYINTNISNTNSIQNTSDYNNIYSNMDNNKDVTVKKTQEEQKVSPTKVGNGVDLFTPILQNVPKDVSSEETKEEQLKEPSQEVKEEVDDTETL